MRTFKQFISEMVSAEKALQRLHAMRRAVPQPHITLDDKGKASFANKYAIKLPYERGEHHADEAFERDAKMAQWRSNAGLGLQAKDRSYKKRKLSDIVNSPSKLNFGQDSTDATEDEKLKSKSDPNQTHSHTVIATHTDENGKKHHTVFDGHHALIGSIARSVNPTVRHLDLDAEEKMLRDRHPEHEPKQGDY